MPYYPARLCLKIDGGGFTSPIALDFVLAPLVAPEDELGTKLCKFLPYFPHLSTKKHQLFFSTELKPT